MRAPRRTTGAALTLLCLFCAACSDNDGDGPTPFVATFESATCEMPLPEGQNPANVGCGWLTVPENRGRPEGRTIKLAVVTLAATGTNPEPDPLVILSGGPGAWAIDGTLPMFTGDFAAPIQSKRGIVIFDQRGSGRSQPALNCPEAMSYRDALGILTTTEQDAEIDAQIFLACRDRLVREGNDLSGYSSAATAQRVPMSRVLAALLLAATGLAAISACQPKPLDPKAALIAKGRDLFFNETFGGNGRTCGTCHRQEENLTITPEFIATLPKDDPLFVAEFVPALKENFENPRLMREFGLIKENLDGFDSLATRFTMRGVPHTLALGTSVQSPAGPRTG